MYLFFKMGICVLKIIIGTLALLLLIYIYIYVCLGTERRAEIFLCIKKSLIQN